VGFYSAYTKALENIPTRTVKRSISIKRDKGTCSFFFFFFFLLFNKKNISVAPRFFLVSFLLAATASVDAYQFSPQVALQNARYESQGFRILSSEHVDNYSIRIKQPKSCESGVQVICGKNNNGMPTFQILIFMTVLWLH